MALANELADLYPDEGNQRRIADQIGIGALVDIDGPPIVVWVNIVREARQRRRIGALIVAVLTDYPNNGNLQAAIDDELSRRIPVPYTDDNDDRNERRINQSLIMDVLARLEKRIEAVQDENVRSRHAQANTLQTLVSQVAVLVSKDAARERREENMQESISALGNRMGAVEGAIRSLTAEGRAESYVRAPEIRQAIWLALGFVAGLSILLIAAQYLAGML